MSDDTDRATEREELARQDAIAAQVRRAGLSGKTVADSARDCRLCDEPITHGRREALPGVQACIECQGDLDRAVRGRGK